MKFLAVVTLVALISSTLAKTKEEQEEEDKKVAEECVKLTGVDKGPLEKIAKGIVDDDPKLAEFLFCFYKKEGLLNDAGEYDPEMLRDEITKMVNSTIADTIVDNCTKEKYSSGLETSVELTKCYYKYAPPNKE